MPREKVNSVDGNGFTVEIGWSPGGSMQLGVKVDDSTTILRQLYSDPPLLERIGRRAVKSGLAPFGPPVEKRTSDELRQLGEQVLDLVEGPPVNPELGDRREDIYRGLWTTLNRNAANGLVRHLRKARDSAFGRDE